ncbi:MAG: hypothetical protein R2795_02790 [Saprospiraceae bacterium]
MKPDTSHHFLPQVHGISVNKVHGYEPSIALAQRLPLCPNRKYGRSFLYGWLPLQFGTPFTQIRSISNHVEKRQRDKWNLPLAIDNLNKVLLQLWEA